MRFLLVLLINLFSLPALADELLWQGEVENTKTRIIIVNNDSYGYVSYQVFIMNRWETVLDNEKAIKILKGALKK